MQPKAGNLLCSACGSHVETPAFFCDMCGVPFPKASAAIPAIAALGSEQKTVVVAPASSGFTPSIGEDAPNTNAPSTQPPEVDWNELAIRVGIPVAIVALGIFLMVSKNKDAHTILLLLLPAMIGTIVGAANLEQVNLALESINNWTVEKLAARKDGDGKRHRFFFKPWHWLLTRINAGTDSIGNPLVRNGVTVGAYFYLLSLFAFLAYIAVVVVVGIIILGIVFWIISEVSDSDKGSYVSSGNTAAKRVRGKKLYDTSGIFRRQVGEVDENGRVLDTTGFFKREVARVSDDGKVSDTTGFFSHNVAKIDEDGTISDTTGFFNKEVGKIDEDGRILDTRGFFNKETGKLE